MALGQRHKLGIEANPKENWTAGESQNLRKAKRMRPTAAETARGQKVLTARTASVRQTLVVVFALRERRRLM